MTTEVKKRIKKRPLLQSRLLSLTIQVFLYLASFYKFGWGGGIRTPEYQDQNLVPYHLATSHRQFDYNLLDCVGVLVTILLPASCQSVATPPQLGWRPSHARLPALLRATGSSHPECQDQNLVPYHLGTSQYSYFRTDMILADNPSFLNL